MFRLLLALFIFVPLAELGIFLTLGSKIGPLPTIAIIILTGILGASLTKMQGAKALSSFRSSMAAGQLPHREILDGLLILIAGALLLTPGFLTDALGFLLILPSTRSLIRKPLCHYLSRKIKFTFNGMPIQPSDMPQPGLKQAKGKVIDI